MPASGRHEIFQLACARLEPEGARERRARTLLGLEPRQFRLLIEDCPVGFAIAEVRRRSAVSHDSRLVYANRAYELHMGVARDRVVGLWLSDLLAGEAQGWLQINDWMLRSGSPAVFVMNQCAHGRWTEVRSFPISRSIFGGWVLDVTDRVEPQEAIQVEDVVVRHSPRSVTVRGTEVPLTPTEFDILWVLARSAGTPCSIAELTGHDSRGREGSPTARLEVHVSRLRRKLGESARKPRLLHTVRGVGYRLGPAGSDAVRLARNRAAGHWPDVGGPGDG